MEQFNQNNIQITEKDIINILNIYDIKINKIKNIEYYNIAFTHKSYVKPEEENYSFINILDNTNTKNNIMPFRNKSYERYEFQGDNLLNSIIVEYLFNRFSEEKEDVLTRIKTQIVSSKYFSKFAKKLNFGKYLIISNNMENIYNAREMDTILEDVFEAFACALYKDQGREVLTNFIIKIIEDNINFSKILFNNQNYKDRLTKISQKEKLHIKFITDTMLGQPNQRTYIVSLLINKKDTRCLGYGHTKIDAEQDCSLNYLLKNGYINEEEQIVIKG
jgi:ribonuclease-3